jgi:hypothetical protein
MLPRTRAGRVCTATGEHERRPKQHMKLNALVLAVAVVGCKSDKPLPPFAFDKCDGSVGFQKIRHPLLCATSTSKSMNMVVGVALHGTELVAALGDYEVGTKISAGSIKPSEQGDVVRVPIGDKLGTITLDHLQGKVPVDLGVTLTIDSPRYAPANLAVPPITIAPVFYDTATAEKLLVQDKLGVGPTAPAKHSTYISERGYVLGDATSLAEIDWVALPTFKEVNESETCPYATEKQQRVDVTKAVEVYTVKLVDRRTGQVIETRDFRAVGECPGFTSAHTIRLSFDSASWKAVETWIAEKMASTPPS